MSKKKIKIIVGIVILSVMFLFMQLYSVDLLPESLQGDKYASESEAKGKAVLKQAWIAHGVDSLNAHQVYQFTTVDHWQGMMAGMGKLWPQKKTALTFKYAPNTFDARLEFLDGETKGLVAGLTILELLRKAGWRRSKLQGKRKCPIQFWHGSISIFH